MSKEKGISSAPVILEQILLSDESAQRKTDVSDGFYYLVFGLGGGVAAGMILGAILGNFVITVPVGIGAGLYLSHKFDPAR